MVVPLRFDLCNVDIPLIPHLTVLCQASLDVEQEQLVIATPCALEFRSNVIQISPNVTLANSEVHYKA